MKFKALMIILFSLGIILISFIIGIKYDFCIGLCAFTIGGIMLMALSVYLLIEYGNFKEH